MEEAETPPDLQPCATVMRHGSITRTQTLRDSIVGLRFMVQVLRVKVFIVYCLGFRPAMLILFSNDVMCVYTRHTFLAYCTT